MKFCPSFLLALTLLLFWNMPVLSAEKSDAVLEAVTFQTDADKGESVRFKLNGEHTPKIFTIQDANPRLVLDFPDTRCSNQVNRAIDTKGKLVKKIRVGIHNDQAPKIRVVVDLAPNGEYQHKQHFDAQDKTLVVTIFSTNENVGPKEKGKKEEKVVAAKEPDAQKPALTVQKEHAQSSKVAESKQPEKATHAKADEEARSAQSKTTEKKEAEAIIPPPKVSVPDKTDSIATTPGLVESGSPLPEKKEVEPILPKQAEGAAKAPEKAVSATSEAENTAAVSHPPDKPSAGGGAEEPKPEVMGAKKQVAGKEEKAASKAETPEKKSAGKKSEPSLSKVTFENTSAKGEMVLFKLNGFYPPTVFGIEKGEPKVVCDFPNVRLDEHVQEVIHCNGRFVESVRVTKQKKQNNIRAVLNLVPDRNYDLQQVFFKEDNLFVIIVNSQDTLPEGKSAAH